MRVPGDGNGNGSGEFAVIVSDLADSEARDAHRWLRENVSPEYADRWLEGLTRAIEGLAVLPHRHALARENDLYDVEVRHLLYYGPSRRRGSVYRILFHVIAPTEDEAEGVVRVLHIWHGASQKQS